MSEARKLLKVCKELCEWIEESFPDPEDRPAELLAEAHELIDASRGEKNYPRYFMGARGKGYFRFNSPTAGVLILSSGRATSCQSSLADIERRVAEGRLREVTAQEVTA